MWRSALRFSALGLEMGIAVAIGYGLGWWLDSKLGTKPTFTMIMLLLGVAAGFRGIVRVARQVQREQDADGDGDSR